MKTSEECFLEITNRITSELNNDKDDGHSIVNNIIHYYKVRNFDKDYVYKGSIVLEKCENTNNIIKMDYFFSNKRSYLSINKKNIIEGEYNKLQYYLLLYTDKLFIKYNIDTFIYGLNLNNSKTFFINN